MTPWTESLFDVLADDQVRAVAAHEVGHHEREHLVLRYSLVALGADGGDLTAGPGSPP